MLYNAVVWLSFAAWVGCGVINAGITYAYFQRGFRIIADERRNDDVLLSLFAFITGPVGLLVMAVFLHGSSMGFQGWMLPGSVDHTNSDRSSR